MRTRIYKNGQLVNTLDMKVSKREGRFDRVRTLEAMQREEDIIGAGKTGDTYLGIRSLTTRDGVTFNEVSDNSNNVFRDDGSYILGSNVGNRGYENENVSINGVDCGFQIKLFMYDTGWILNCGRKSANLFGQIKTMYLKSIGSRNTRCTSKEIARVFTTPKSILAYLEKNRTVLEYLAKSKGYTWTLEYTCDFFEEDWINKMSDMKPKQKEKTEDLFNEINKLLDAINSCEEEEENDEVLPEEVTPEIAKDEALKRMEDFNLLSPVIRDFRDSGKLYMSLGGGIIYDLDESAKIAVDEARNNGVFPYHVVVTESNIGHMYSVLYVSTASESWKYERLSKSGDIETYCYNATDPYLSEYGTSRFVSANGGLVRVA